MWPTPPSWIELQDDGEPSLQVFVHGYETAEGEEELARWGEQVRRLAPRGRVILFRWGEVRAGDKVAVRLLRDAIGSVPVASSASTADQHPSGGARVADWLAARGGALVRETMRFWSRAALADRLAPTLLQGVRETLGHRTAVELWGHSLGARLILASLAQGDWSKLPLERVVLMAAAADAAAENWRRAAEQVRGQLVHCYSPRDWVLRLAPLWSRPAGLGPIPQDAVASHPRKLLSHRCDYSHGEYWERLRELGERIRVRGGE